MPKLPRRSLVNDVCNHTGKVRFLNKRQAKLKVKWINSNFSKDMSVYRCDSCGGWHLTNYPRQLYRMQNNRGNSDG